VNAKVYTIGYGNRRWNQVCEIMTGTIDYDPAAVFDVRANPWCRWCSDWRSMAVMNLAEAAGYIYEWVGGLVGNPRRLSQAKFLVWLKAEKMEALDEFTALAGRYLMGDAVRKPTHVVLLCACLKNADEYCHRFPLAEHLRNELGTEVEHL